MCREDKVGDLNLPLPGELQLFILGVLCPEGFEKKMCFCALIREGSVLRLFTSQK